MVTDSLFFIFYHNFVQFLTVYFLYFSKVDHSYMKMK